MQIPLSGGSYTAQNVVANVQRCVNLYPESNSQGAQYPYTYYPTPGLTLIVAPPLPGIYRCLYPASNGKLYGVIGGNVYYINSSWEYTKLGEIDNLVTPVAMADNGNTIVVVDGTTSGYFINMLTNVMVQIADANFLGASRADYLDTFLLFNQPGTKNFYSTLSNVTTFDPLYKAAKTGYPDDLISLIVVHREIWLLGRLTSEIWFNAGNPTFPFSIVQGVFLQFGCIAPYSVVRHGLEIFWLHQDKDGKALVMMGVSYQAKTISTYAVEQAIQTYAKIDDAIGMTYQIQGHVFYVLTFPSADKTWVFDKEEALWHELAWIDNNGIEHRHRANCMAFAYGKNLAGDWQNGNLYQVDPKNFTDNGDKVIRRRSFQTLGNESKRTQYKSFAADMGVGEGAQLISGSFNNDFNDDFDILSDDQSDLQVFLRWSDDRGKTWSNPMGQTLGAKGEYSAIPAWNRLGMGRNRVFELFWSCATKTALNGANVEGLVLQS